jgi:SAM-dependent methyltransferase
MRAWLEASPPVVPGSGQEQPDVFANGLFPVCPATHDLGVRRLFDLSTLLLLLDCQPGDRVLDLGGGSGFSSEMLARLGYSVVAADPDHSALRSNRRRVTFDRRRILGDVRVVGGVAEALPLSGRQFDGAVCMNVLHHVEDLDAATSELSRVLKPGARAVFCEPGLDHLHWAETVRARDEHGENDHAFDVVAFLERALSLGFREAMLSATLQSPLRLLPVQELDLYLSGRHPRPHMTPAGVVEELHRRHAFGMLVNDGDKPKTSRHPGRLACSIRLGPLPQHAAPGQSLEVAIEASNTGDTTWLATPSPMGRFVTIGMKLLTAEGRLWRDDLGRTFLQRDVRPGEETAVVARWEMPRDLPGGEYQLKFDLVNEQAFWFSDLEPASAQVVRIDVRTRA